MIARNQMLMIRLNDETIFASKKNIVSPTITTVIQELERLQADNLAVTSVEMTVREMKVYVGIVAGVTQ